MAHLKTTARLLVTPVCSFSRVSCLRISGRLMDLDVVTLKKRKKSKGNNMKIFSSNTGLCWKEE